MKDGVSEIVGKTISSVVVGSNDRDPQNQVMLVFSDGTYFEFYGPEFYCTSGVDQGTVQDVLAYIRNLGGQVTAKYSG